MSSKSTNWRRALTIALSTCVVTYMVFVGLLGLLQRKMIFAGADQPARPVAGLDEAGAERWWLDTPEGRVEAWFLPGKGASADAPGPAVIIAHGNGEAIDDWLHGLPDRYRDAGISVLLPEYRGYGRLAGTPSQAHITADYAKFDDRLAARDEVDAGRIFFHGFSLGGAVVASLARVRTPKALILQSTFTSIADMAKGFPFPVPRFIIRDPFDTIGEVRRLHVPMLIVHGRLDDVIPFSHGQKLAQAAHDADFVVHGGGHHLMNDAVAFWRAVRKLLARAHLVNPT